MSSPAPDLKLAAEAVVAHVRGLLENRHAPLLVAVDGGSGFGKSTIASLIAEELGAALIPSDDFFAAEITDAGWDSRNAAARTSAAIDWRRLRAEVLEPLLAGSAAS
jgi:uridine kinase